MKYLVAKKKCGCIVSALFSPLEDMEVLKKYLMECMEQDYIIEMRSPDILVCVEKCLVHQGTTEHFRYQGARAT